MGYKYTDESIKLYNEVVRILCVSTSAPLSDIAMRVHGLDNRQGFFLFHLMRAKYKHSRSS